MIKIEKLAGYMRENTALGGWVVSVYLVFAFRCRRKKRV